MADDQNRKIALYGSNARTLDHPWFGEVWVPMDKSQLGAHYAKAQDNIVDPQELDLEPGHQEPELCFSRSQVRDPAYALLDSGATHVLLPGHTLPKGGRAFDVTIHLAVGKEKARCWRNEVYAEDRLTCWTPSSLGRMAKP